MLPAAVVCPFYGCAAYVELVIEQATPDDDETIARRHPFHNVQGGYSWFGACPASFQAYPPSSSVMLALRSMTRHLIRMENDRAAMTAVAGDMQATGQAPWQHSKTPHPDVDPVWFRCNPGPKFSPRR